MHELPVTEKILDIALRHAEQNGLQKIHSITLMVGGLTDLEDHWLQRYFEYLSKDTCASTARLVIKRIPITLRCGECRTHVETTKEEMATLSCPHCNKSQTFTLISGRDYFIEEMVAE